MLRIRKAQFDVLEADLVRKFEDGLVRKTAEEMPDKFSQMGEERVRVLIRAAIPRARGYALESREDMEPYVLLVVERGYDFEQLPEMKWCREILEDKSLPGDAKIKLIRHELRAQAAA